MLSPVPHAAFCQPASSFTEGCTHRQRGRDKKVICQALAHCLSDFQSLTTFRCLGAPSRDIFGLSQHLFGSLSKGSKVSLHEIITITCINLFAELKKYPNVSSYVQPRGTVKNLLFWQKVRKQRRKSKDVTKHNMTKSLQHFFFFVKDEAIAESILGRLFIWNAPGPYSFQQVVLPDL